MSNQLQYLSIPNVEKLVPFPNFATILLQHAREFPHKIALRYDNSEISYLELAHICFDLVLPTHDISISFKTPGNDVILFLACLFQGRDVHIDFASNVNEQIKDLDKGSKALKFFEPPYVKLDDLALILDKQYSFSQYKVLLAAQAVGRAFRLFRDGAAYCQPEIKGISDVIFGVLAPLYFCKTLEFVFNDEKDHYQYSWKKTIDSECRDSAFILTDQDEKDAHVLIHSFDKAMGIGPLIDPSGKLMEFLGYEINKQDGEWTIAGHGIANELK